MKGLIGEKLGHSYSQEIHKALGGYDYALVELAQDQVLPFLGRREFSAINVTIPYKELVMQVLDHIHPLALAVGAVNTIVNRDGKLYGYNTDCAGMEAMFAQAGIEVEGKKVLILGSGGTSKTAQAVLGKLNANACVVSRYPKSGEMDYAQARKLHSDAQVIVNTTPVGMAPDMDGCPVDLADFPHLVAVADVIYNPTRTALLEQAQARGLQCAGGLTMLVMQAVYAIEHFTQKRVSTTAALALCKELALRKRNIVLIGMPCCGKSTIGALLAQEMGRDFVDLDAQIACAAGMSIPEIFMLHGEAKFREMESEQVLRFSRQTGLVIATGGGVVSVERNMQRLRRSGHVVFMERPLDRLIPGKERPLLRSTADVQALYVHRLPLYQKYADTFVSNDQSTMDAVRCIQEEFYENTYT